MGIRRFDLILEAVKFAAIVKQVVASIGDETCLFLARAIQPFNVD
jgi:hypothetical protein